MIPASTTLVVVVARLDVLGQPLDDDRVHRVELVCAATGARPGRPWTRLRWPRPCAMPDGYPSRIPARSPRRRLPEQGGGRGGRRRRGAAGRAGCPPYDWVAAGSARSAGRWHLRERRVRPGVAHRAGRRGLAAHGASQDAPARGGPHAPGRAAWRRTSRRASAAWWSSWASDRGGVRRRGRPARWTPGCTWSVNRRLARRDGLLAAARPATCAATPTRVLIALGRPAGGHRGAPEPASSPAWRPGAGTGGPRRFARPRAAHPVLFARCLWEELRGLRGRRRRAREVVRRNWDRAVRVRRLAPLVDVDVEDDYQAYPARVHRRRSASAALELCHGATETAGRRSVRRMIITMVVHAGRQANAHPAARAVPGAGAGQDA